MGAPDLAPIWEGVAVTSIAALRGMCDDSIHLMSGWMPELGRNVQPALAVIGRHSVTERDSAPVQYNGIVSTQPVLVH